MLERLAAWVLNAYLGEYLEDLNTDQLSIGLLKGAVELEGLPLKKDALRKLDLPLEVKSGFVGKISLNIPLTGFASQPWVINMDRLYVIAGPAAPENDETAKSARQQERKAKMLDELETLWQTERKVQAASPTAPSSASYWLSFGSGLVYNVVENLQLKVTNVHIRYEDVLSNSQPYAFGVVIRQLSAQSTDENWVPKYVSCATNNLMRKVVDLSELSIYWATDVAHYAHLDHRDIVEALERGAELCHQTSREAPPQFLLEPVSGRVRLQRNTSSLPLRSPQTPRLRVDASFDQFSLALEESQYRGLLGLLKEFERFERRKHNAHPRPVCRVHDGARSWWSFAQLNVLHAIKEKNRRRTRAFLLKRCRDCCDYVKAYKSHLCAQKLSTVAQSLKSTVEREFTYNEIKVLRDVAADQLRWEGLWFLVNVGAPLPARAARASDAQPLPKLPSSQLLTSTGGNSMASSSSSSSSTSASQVGRLFSWAWSKFSAGGTVAGSTLATPVTSPTSTLAPSDVQPDEREPDVAGRGGRILLTDAERQQLEQEIQDALGEVQQESAGLLVRDAVFAELNFTLGSGSFALKFNDGGADGGALKLVCNRIKAGLTSQPRTHSLRFSLSLGGMYVQDLYNKKTVFPYLVSPRDSGRKNCEQLHETSLHGDLSASVSGCTNESSTLFNLLYELRPSDISADHRLWVQTKPLDIVYNEAVMRCVKDFFIPKRRSTLGSTFGSELDLAAKALRRYEELKDRTKADIQTTLTKLLDGEQAVMTARRWHVSLDIAAPQIIIPRSCVSTSETTVIFDLGRIQMDNVRPQREAGLLPAAPEDTSSAVLAGIEQVLLSQHSSMYFDSEENFVTPCSTPPADFEAEAPQPDDYEEDEATKVLTAGQDSVGVHEPAQRERRKSIDSLSSSLYGRLYERYTLKLSDAQVLVGTLHYDSGWQQASQRGSSPLHILDKFTVTVQFDRRLVLASDPQYPAVKLSGSIDSLKAHLTEAKVRALSGCADLLLGPPTASKPPPQRQHSVAAHQTLSTSFLWTPGTEKGHRHGSKLLEESKLTLLDFVVKELSVDIQSRGRCIAELQVSDVVALCQRRPSELELSFTVQTLLVVDALQTYGPDFELLVASHRNVVLDSRSGSLLASQVGSPTSPSSPPPATSPPPLLLHSPSEPAVTSTEAPHGGAFLAFQSALMSRMHKLLSSTGASHGSGSGCPADQLGSSPPQPVPIQPHDALHQNPDAEVEVSNMHPLIVVNYRLAIAKSNRSGPARHEVNICFNSLDLVANQGTIVELLHFFRTALPRTVTAVPEFKNSEGVMVIPKVHLDPVQIAANFNRLNILLMCTTERMKRKTAQKIATATLSQSRVSVSLGSITTVEGHIGGLQVVDVMKDTKYPRIFSVGHDPVCSSVSAPTDPSFHEPSSQSNRNDAFYFYYNDGGRSASSAAEPGHIIVEEALLSSGRKQQQQQLGSSGSSCLKLKLGSMEYLHNPEFLSNLAVCAHQFRGYLNQLAMSLKTAASDIAMSIVKKHTQQLPVLNSVPDSGCDVAGTPAPPRQPFDTGQQQSSQPGSPERSVCGLASNDTVGYLQLDVDLDTPVIMMPRSQRSDEMLVAHLGRMTVSNTRSLNMPNLNSVLIVDSVLLGIADIRLYTALYGKTDAGRESVIIDDAALELTVDYHHLEKPTNNGCSTLAAPEFILNSEDDDAAGGPSMVEVKGTVTRGMQVVLSRTVCEQIGETISALTYSGPPAGGEPESVVSTSQSLSESAPSSNIVGAGQLSVQASLSALKLDDECDVDSAAAAPAPCSSAQDVPRSVAATGSTSDAVVAASFVQVKIMFSMETLSIAVLGDLGDACKTNIVDVTFSEFCLSAEKIEPYVVAVDLRLHGFHVHDRLHPKGSSHGLLVTSSPRVTGLGKSAWSKPSFISMSCPDATVPVQYIDSTAPSSFPEAFQAKHGVGRSAGYLHQGAAASHSQRPVYPSTPPCSPANERSDVDVSVANDSSLVNVSLMLVNPSYPGFKSDFDQVTCIASVTFNCLEVVVNLETWVVLLDFLGIGAKVFSEAPVASPLPVDPPAMPLSSDKIKVTLKVSSLAVVLNKSAYELARASVQGLSTTVLKSDDAIHFKGTLSKMSVVDLSPRGRLYPEKLVTVGGSALSFDVLKYSKPDPHLTRACDISVMLDMSSVCYTHTKRFQCEVLNYFQDFNDQYDALGHMRAAAAGQKVPALGGRSPRILLRINTATPIILLPQSSSSTSVLIVHLGNLLLENKFLFAGQDGTLSSAAGSSSGCPQSASAIREVITKLRCNFVDASEQTEESLSCQAADCMTQSVIGSLEDDLRHEQLVESITLLEGQNLKPSTQAGASGSDEDYCCLLDAMSITLSDMDLYSGLRFNTAPAASSADSCATTASPEAIVFSGYAIQKEANHPLKEKCMLKLVVERNLDNDLSHNSPELALHGSLSSVCCAIDASQYKLVHGILDKNLGEDMPDLVRLRKQDPKIQTVLSGKVYRTLFFVLDMHNVSVELFRYGNSLDCNATQPLAKLDFIKSHLTFEGFSNQSKNVDLVSREIRVVDTRYRDSTANTRPNRFIDILQPAGGDKQLSSSALQAELHYHSSDHGPARITILLNNMRVMAITGWWMALKHFFMVDAKSTAINVELDPSRQHPGATETSALLEAPRKKEFPLQFKLNLTDTELVLVEDPSAPDTNAVILRATVIMQYSPTASVPSAGACSTAQQQSERLLSCSLHGIELFSCCLAAEDSTAMSIVDPVNASLELCKSQACAPYSIPTALDLPRLEVSLTNFNVRLSYTDLLLFRAIAKSFTQLNEQLTTATSTCTLVPTACERDKTQSDTANSSLSATAAATKQAASPLEAALVASVEVKVDLICLCFIDDCGAVDIPLVELRLKDCLVTQHMYSQFGGEANFTLNADCYNRMLSGWEPLLEPWTCCPSWSLNLLGDNNVSIKVKSDDILNINVTGNFLELLRTTKKAWVDDYSSRLVANQKHHSYDSKVSFTPYRLRNLTGCTIWLLPFVTDSQVLSKSDLPTRASESSPPWHRVEHDSEVPLAFAEKDKLRHQSTHELKTRQLCVQIDGYHEVTPIVVDATGTYYRMAKPTGYNTALPPARVVFQISLEKNAFKVITIRSSLVLINELSESVEVKLESLVQNGVAKSLLLDPGKWLPVPIRLAFCRVWVRPAVWDLPFCNQPIEWHNDAGDEATAAAGGSVSPCSGPRVCQAQPPQSGAYRFCATTRRDDYPESRSTRAVLADGRSCTQPGHTITLLPPLTLVNLLPLELAYYVRGSEACGKISSGSSACIFTVNVAVAMELGITLENYPTCRELVIPPGTTEYKCKMQLCDSKDRALYIQAYVRSKKGGGALKVSFSAPFWLVNRSGLPLVFRQDGTRMETAGQFEEHEMARSVAPLPFCFPDREAASLCIMRVGRSVHGTGSLPQWCQRFVLENGVTVRSLHVTPTDNRPDWVYDIGIEVHQGTAKYADTRFVTFAPRFQLSNQSSYKLAFSQRYGVTQGRNDDTFLTALPRSSLAFHWPRVDFDQLLCIRILDDQNQWQWSGGFRIDTINSFYINVRGRLGTSLFLQVEVALQGATYVVVFADASDLPPPLRIDNRTEVSMRFWQANTGDERLKTIVKPGCSVAYAWDEPTLDHNLMCTVLGTGSATVGTYNMDAIGEGEQLQYENFIYIAFTHTFDKTKWAFDSASGCQELVLDVVNGNQVTLSRKEIGKRSQLWRMTSSGMIEHEGSSVPRDLTSRRSSPPSATAAAPQSGYVLDIADIAVLPNSMSQALLLQKPNPRRQTTQRWMFKAGGRLVCGAEGRCVQAPAELRPGVRVVLGPAYASGLTGIDVATAAMMTVEPQRMLPGSGVISVSVVPDGPTRVLRLIDFHRRSGSIPTAQASHLHAGPEVGRHDSLTSDNKELRAQKHVKLMCIMPRGVGISIVNSVPEELVYASLSDIYLELSDSAVGLQLEARFGKLQVDNQLLSSSKPVMLAVTQPSKKANEDTTPALFVSFHKLPGRDWNCTVFKHMRATLKPVVLSMEEVLLWKLVAFFGLAQSPATSPNKINELELELQRRAMSMPQARRYYFELLSLAAHQICLSMTTTSGLSPDLRALKRRTGIPLISFEDAKIELDPFVQKYLFETQEFLVNVVLTHFKGEVQRQAGKILGSVNFLGNPLGLFNDMANGLNSLIVDGNVSGLVKNVAHGASDSLAKVAGTLAQGIGRLALDDDHERSRAAYRQRQREDGMVAGFLGLGHGIFGGLTSLVSQTYDGAIRGGVEGMLAGIAKGAVGTVAKPVAGLLDFASGAASAVRDTSRGQQQQIGERVREPRCCCGGGTAATSRLLQTYREDRALMQRDLLHLVTTSSRGNQGPGPNEKLVDLLELQQRSDSDGLSLSCLITDRGLYIVNGAMTVNSVSLSIKYSELISCAYVERSMALGSSAVKPRCYLEIKVRYDGGSGSSVPSIISTTDDGMRSRAPQFRCDSPAVCRLAVSTILLAKAQHDERLYAVTLNTELPSNDQPSPSR